MLVAVGALALGEARRLGALREEMVAGAVVGDDTFPMIVGIAFLLLGAYALVRATPHSVPVQFPRGAERTRLLESAGVVIAYTVVVPYLGYTASTFLASTALFKTMGSYRWEICLLLGLLITGALHMMFRVWLLQPLPSGWLGI